jgi:6-phosphogluconate dehydrogenase
MATTSSMSPRPPDPVVGEATCDIGVIGLATMGANLARNAARKGSAVAVHNRSPERTAQLIERHGGEGALTPCDTLETFVSALRTPRAIILSVAAGKPVDDLVGQLSPLLDPGDILVDAGNSHFADTERRIAAAEASGLRYIGMGVSGGEKGALEGPSMMPGGSLSAYRHLAPMRVRRFGRVGPLREDGPQRHRICRHAGDRRGV